MPIFAVVLQSNACAALLLCFSGFSSFSFNDLHSFRFNYDYFAACGNLYLHGVNAFAAANWAEQNFVVDDNVCGGFQHDLSFRVVLWFRLEFLAVDSVFSVEPVAVLVAFAMIAVLDGCVAVSQNVVGWAPLVFQVA